MSESNRDYFARLTGGLSLQVEEDMQFRNKRDQELYDLKRGPVGPRCFECHSEGDTHYFDLWDEWLCPNHAATKLHALTQEALRGDRDRIAALVALCEQMLYDLEGTMPPQRAGDLGDYRARLDALKEAG